MTIITDAGFRGQWFRQVSERGWTYICRVMGRQYYRVGDVWEKVSPLIFAMTSLEYSLDTLRRRYNDMVLVY